MWRYLHVLASSVIAQAAVYVWEKNVERVIEKNGSPAGDLCEGLLIASLMLLATELLVAVVKLYIALATTCWPCNSI